MTFKHLKFAESSTMQAFEKLAKAKGLVKPEVVTKTATKTLDLNPSENLLENILKLAQGLRAQGFSKHANDLENKFLVFKKAESLYETSKETGEDLVDQAHPQGSKKMDGTDHTVLTIVDQKKKIEEIVNKKPHGKLTTADEIIDAVKLALGGDFLGNGGASNHKIAQDKKPAESSSTAGTVAETAGFFGGMAGLKWLWSKFRGSPALDKQLVKNVESALGRNLSKAEANALSKQIVEKVGQEEMQKVLGKQVAQDVGKKVTTEVAETAAKSLTENAAKSVATNAAKSPGTWARIVSYFGRPIAGSAGGAVAGEGAAVAGGAAVEGGAAAGGASLGATIALPAIAGIVAAGVTYLITSAIYENKFYTPELNEAGKKLVSELEDVQKIAKWQSQRAKEIAFQQNFNKAMASADKAQNLIKSPSPAGLAALKEYSDALQDASTAAYNLSAAARGIYTGDDTMKPGESREDNTFWTDTVGTSPFARLFGADAPQLADIVIAGANFVNVAQKALVDVRVAINTIMDIVVKEEAKHAAAGGGAPAQDLAAAYTKYLGLINKWSLQIGEQKSTIKEAPQVLAWLEKYKAAITAEQNNFNGKSAEDKKTVYSFYEKRFNEKVKSTLDSFEKYGKDKGWLK